MPQANFFAVLGDEKVLREADRSAKAEEAKKHRNLVQQQGIKKMQEQKQGSPWFKNYVQFQETAKKKQQSRVNGSSSSAGAKFTPKPQQPSVDPATMKAKPLVVPEKFSNNNFVIRKPKRNPLVQGRNGRGEIFYGRIEMKSENLEKKQGVEETTLTLQEYERLKFEKTNEALEERKEHAEWTKIVGNKKEEILKSDQEINNENIKSINVHGDGGSHNKNKKKACKSISINAFLKPVEGGQTLAADQKSKFVDAGQNKCQHVAGTAAEKLNFEDDAQFPVLGMF